MTFSERLKQLIDLQFDGDRSFFQKASQIPYTTITEYINEVKKNPPLQMLNKIMNCVPNVNANWLLLGQEPMMLPEGWKNYILNIHGESHVAVYNKPLSMAESPPESFEDELLRDVDRIDKQIQSMKNNILQYKQTQKKKK